MDVNISIIGAGVIGLAIARRISEDHGDIVVLERHGSFGKETSSRNSEVIHSGIYYPKNSLKAKLCVEGNALLYDFCSAYDVPHQNCGKLIIAQNEEQLKELHSIRKKGEDNGVRGVELLGKTQIAALEPNVRAAFALSVPSTGIIDTHTLMQRLESMASNQGVHFAYLTKVTSISKNGMGYTIKTMDQDGNDFEFTSRKVINCAGLESDQIAYMAGISNPMYKITFCKGEYFRVRSPKNKLVKHLIYPTPFKDLAGLGIHTTLEMDGGMKLGPDITFQDENSYDYSVDVSKREKFYKAASSYLPFLEPDDLEPEMAGIRPKIQKEGEPVKDFIIKEESDSGFPGLINLIGMESPGLSSSLAIAEYVSKLI
jgi:L-2-hydroxyglutarate oxidase LhgO